MSIVRTVKNTNYTTISNVILNDARLTWKARGIAAYLLSKPDDWRVNYEHLVSAAPDGRSAVLAAMRELEECGYISRYRFQGDDGRWRSEVVLHETPGAPSVENQHPATGEKPSVEKPTAGKPTAGKPTAGKPTAGKSAPLLNPENQTLKPNPDYQSLTTQPEDGGAREGAAHNRGEGGEQPSITEGGEGERSKTTPRPERLPKPLTDAQFAVKEALVGVGVSPLKANDLAYTWPPEHILAHIDAARAELEAGEIGAGAIAHRIENRPTPRQPKPATDYALPTAPPLAADPPPAPTRPPRDVALVQDALKEQLPTLANHVTEWPIRIDGAAVTVDAGHRAEWVSRIQPRMQAAVSSYLQRPVTLSIVGIQH